MILEVQSFLPVQTLNNQSRNFRSCSKYATIVILHRRLFHGSIRVQ